jgi:hypothetical protein
LIAGSLHCRAKICCRSGQSPHKQESAVDYVVYRATTLAMAIIALVKRDANFQAVFYFSLFGLVMSLVFYRVYGPILLNPLVAGG